MSTVSPTGPVSAVQPRPSKGRPRGAPWTPERAKLVAIEREAAKRARREQAATFRAKVASPPDPLDSRARTASSPAELAPGLRNAEPAPVIELGDLVDVDGVLTPRVTPPGSLTMPEPLKLKGAPRIDAGPERVGVPREGVRSPRLPGKPDLAMPREARVRAPRPVEVEVPELEPVKLPPVVKLDPPAPDPAEEVMRIARARVAMSYLFTAIRSPHLARFSIPWQPAVLVRAGVCDGCAQRVAADRVEGHAISAATKPTPKLRCVRWAFGIPESQA